MTDSGAKPLCLPRVFAGAHSEMYIVHIDVAIPTARPATKPLRVFPLRTRGDRVEIRVPPLPR